MKLVTAVAVMEVTLISLSAQLLLAMILQLGQIHLPQALSMKEHNFHVIE